MNTTYKVRSVGGALVVTLPQHIVRFTRLKAGDPVTIICEKSGMIRIQKSGSRGNGTKK